MFIFWWQNYFIETFEWNPRHACCVILQFLDIFFEPHVVFDKSCHYSPEASKSSTAGNQWILCLLFNSAQFHHYETAMTPLSEMCDWAFSSALGHTLCKPSLHFSHHQSVWFCNKTKWWGKHAHAFIFIYLCGACKSWEGMSAVQNTCLVAFLRLLKCIQLYVIFKKVIRQVRTHTQMKSDSGTCLQEKGPEYLMYKHF